MGGAGGLIPARSHRCITQEEKKSQQIPNPGTTCQESKNHRGKKTQIFHPPAARGVFSSSRGEAKELMEKINGFLALQLQFWEEFVPSMRIWFLLMGFWSRILGRGDSGAPGSSWNPQRDRGR